MNKHEARIAQLFVDQLAETRDPDAAADHVLDRMLAARPGPWQTCRVNLPSAMAGTVLSYAEELDGALGIWKHRTAKGTVKPLPFPLPPDDFAWDVAAHLSADQPVEIGSVLKVYALWKRLTAFPCYRAGDLSFLAG